jgi:hypothetical protein
VSPELSKSPSLDHYLESPESEASLNHYLASDSPESDDASFASTDDSVVAVTGSTPDSDSGSTRLTGSSWSTASWSDWSTSSQAEKPKFKSFLRKVLGKVVSKLSKLKFWRRISGPVTGRDVVNAARRELQLEGLVNTGAYVSASSPESQTF